MTDEQAHGDVVGMGMAGNEIARLEQILSEKNQDIADLQDKYAGATLQKDSTMHAYQQLMVQVVNPILTGGNHLALHITNSFGEHPPRTATNEEAMDFYNIGRPGWDGNAWKYDVWACWKLMMQAQAFLKEREGI